MKLQSDECIVCGRSNPIGLGLAFEADANGSAAEWVADARYQGFHGVIHGAIVHALLDDAMWYAAYARGSLTMTAESTIRYKEPLYVGTAVRVTGRATSRRGRVWHLEGELATRPDGRVVASATGVYVEPPADLSRRLTAGVPPPSTSS